MPMRIEVDHQTFHNLRVELVYARDDRNMFVFVDTRVACEEQDGVKRVYFDLEENNLRVYLKGDGSRTWETFKRLEKMYAEDHTNLTRLTK